MQNLLDGDLGANNGGWQWTAGTGTDAAPYFRIFNPVLQSQKFDPQGKYIRRWLPELAQVPGKFIHTPWKMPDEIQNQANCRIGRDYPPPVIEHAMARRRALDLYSRAEPERILICQMPYSKFMPASNAPMLTWPSTA
jgi:deoxyribodipyrimidine photo-lyase